MADARARKAPQGNISPGSILRAGAMSEWASTRSGRIFRRAAMSRHKPRRRRSARRGNGGSAALMAGIDDLDRRSSGIEIALAAPNADAGMPGALVFGARAARSGRSPRRNNGPRLGRRVAQQRQRAFGGRHAGVMQHDAVGPRIAAPLAVIGRGQDARDQRAVGIDAPVMRRAHPPRKRKGPEGAPSENGGRGDRFNTRRGKRGCRNNRSTTRRSGAARRI